MVSHDKERFAAGKAPPPIDRSMAFEIDRITAALRHLYDRITREPLPQRLLDLLSRLGEPYH
jgi:Anti-sigma factor NepR